MGEPQTFQLAELWARSNDDSFEDSPLALVLAALPKVSPKGPWIAGGALRRTLTGKALDSDFDFFFADEDQLKAFVAALEKRGFLRTGETAHHVQLQNRVETADLLVKVQCIRFRYYDSAAAVIDSFDFTICQFAFDGALLTCGPLSLWDLARRKLVVHKITYPVATMRRVLKYGAQGFTACAGCLATILRETAQSPELLTQLDIEYID